jgi:hypothetical protein
MKSKLYKNFFIGLLFSVIGISSLQAQRASVSTPIGVGRLSCGSGTRVVGYFGYNELANTLSNAPSPGNCTPALRIGGTAFSYTTNLASISYNPADTNIYYLWTNLTAPIRTYIWKWPVGTCPGTAIDTIRSFNYDILGVAFDANGIGYMLEYDLVGPPYTTFLRSINFSTGVIGNADTLMITNGRQIYQSGAGDIAISPSGQMFFAVDNKLFTPDYLNYGGPSGKITCTFIDTVNAPHAGANLVGLSYAQGELIASYSGGTPACINREIDPLLGDVFPITATTTKSIVDGASVVSSLGLSKELISITNVTGNTYDVSYNVTIKNVGNIPMRNIQATDNLSLINTLGTVSNVTTSFVYNPGSAFALNASYNGTTNLNLLTTSTTRLSNFPVANNNIIIRVNCRITNILPGVVYNNRAIGTATGFANVLLRDSSTNGNNPDLNRNDVADDLGESVPTPFLVSVAPTTGPCASLVNYNYNQTFGTGTGLSATLPIATGKSFPGNTQYAGSTTQPLLVDQFAITNNANNGNNNDWISIADHTGNANGRMLVVNADVQNNVIYRDTVSLCAGHQYSLSLWAAFLPNSTYQTYCDAFGGSRFPRFFIRVKERTSGLVIAQTSTADITSQSWTQYGFRWVMPDGFSNVVFELINTGAGGCGNDVAIDDIQIGTCSPDPSLSLATTASGCIGSATVFSANVSNSDVIPGAKIYRFEVSPDGISGWTTLQSGASTSYTIPSLAAGDVNRYYRVLIAYDGGSGNINNPSCRFASPNFFLTAKTLSVDPGSASRSKNNICPGDAVNLRVNGGSLGTNAQWRWYTGSCGGTLIGTGTIITVTPSSNTTYYVRAEGDCNTTICRPITITINCDIDDDDDGIPDIVENNGVDIEGDEDFDGVVNYRDNSMPGWVDSNGDSVDDRYDFDQDGIINQFDRDSDNDGIPDVVESAGVDANGDGRIDNYNDTDVDGFSQNVDGNTSGHLVSGSGLGRLDLDGDGLPNFLDADSDGDGIPDIIEAGGIDSNNNGMVDTFTDPDLDGYTNILDTDTNNDLVIDNTNALLRTGIDGNSDGRADSYPNRNQDKDLRANPYDLDSDGDGLSDVLEIRLGQIRISGSSVFIDSNNDGFADGTINGKGWITTIAGLGSLALPNNDGDTRADYLDMDADNDGITDNIEIQTTFLPGANYALPGGVDADNDGLDDTYDNFLGSFSGGRITPVDTDSDGTPDYLDTDSDGDGQSDRQEGNDNNFNRIADDNITLTGVDTDGDGLDNVFDNDNTNHVVTTSQLGDNGIFTGPTPTGTLSMITRSYAFQNDRDWRFNGMILSANILSFTGNLINQASMLRWSYVASEPVAKVILMRSFDGIVYNEVAVFNEANQPNQVVNGSYNDFIGATSGRVYYKLKIVGANTKEKKSNVVSLKAMQNAVSSMTVSPVPASTYFNVNINCAYNTLSEIELLDEKAKSVFKKKEMLYRGANAVIFNDITKFPSGVYLLKVKLDKEYLTTRVVIQ